MAVVGAGDGHEAFPISVFVIPSMVVLGVLALVPTIEQPSHCAPESRVEQSPRAITSWLATILIRPVGDRRFLNAMWVSLEWNSSPGCWRTMIVASCRSPCCCSRPITPRARNALCVLFIVPVPSLARGCPQLTFGKFCVPSIVWSCGISFEDHIRGSDLSISCPTRTRRWPPSPFVDVMQWAPAVSVIIVKLFETLPRQPLEAARLDNARHGGLPLSSRYPCWGATDQSDLCETWSSPCALST